MKWLEKKYRERFANQESKAGINEEELWSSIESEIVATNPPESTYKWISALLVSFITVVLLCWTCWSNNRSELSDIENIVSASSEQQIKSDHSETNNYSRKTEVKISNELVTDKDVELPAQGLSNGSRPGIDDRRIADKTTIISEDGNDSHADVSELLSSENKRNSAVITKENASDSKGNVLRDDTAYADPREDTSFQNPVRDDRKIKGKIQAKSTQPKSDQAQTKDRFTTIPDVITTKNSAEELTRDKLLINKLERIDLDELKTLSISLDLIKLELPKSELLSESRSKKPRTRSALSLALYSGLNTTSQSFNSAPNTSYEEDLNNAFSNELGGQLGATLRYDLSDHMYIGAGIEYVRTENRFDYLLLRDTMIIDVRNSRGELIKGQKARTVVHHNKLSYLSIPLEVGLRSNWNRLEAGAALGVSYSILLSQNGKILSSKNDIVAYTEASINRLYSKNFISLGLNPYIQYNLSDHIGLRFNTAIGYQMHGMSDLIDVNHSVLSVAPSLGLSLKL